MKKTKSICEEKVFDQVYKEHAQSLYNFMYYKCGDIETSQDFVQESFVKLWDNCVKVVFNKAKSFLFTVANNLFLNEVNHKKVIIKHRKHGVKEYTNETPEFLLEEKEFMDRLQNAIAELPSDQREIFLLSRIDKKKYREIAELHQISIKTVEKKMSLALKFLEKNLDILNKL
jgi:RNA polymerase sigma-70 factor (ECF subfamily)